MSFIFDNHAAIDPPSNLVGPAICAEPPREEAGDRGSMCRAAVSVVRVDWVDTNERDVVVTHPLEGRQGGTQEVGRSHLRAWAHQPESQPEMWPARDGRGESRQRA